MELRVGTAGWTLPARSPGDAAGSHLERYGRRFSCVEINSCFYRSHRRSTYARWRGSVPDEFKFALKVPKEVTHERRLTDVRRPLETFLDDSSELGAKRDVLLVQLPPSLSFVQDVAIAFFRLLRSLYQGRVACEPRHVSWFAVEAAAVLPEFAVTLVEADPPPAAYIGPKLAETFRYLRLHGSPEVYKTSYDHARLDAIARDLMSSAIPVWCIFDNTARAAALENALYVKSATES